MNIARIVPSAAPLPSLAEAATLPAADLTTSGAAERARQAQAQAQARRDRASEARELATPMLRPTTAGLGAEAFEEITFQASEREEAEVHDELHDRHVRDAELIHGTLPVEKVMAVLRMMEGQYGFQTLRNQARIFARDFQTDPHGALERLKTLHHQPSARFALLRMAEDLLQRAQHQPETAATVQALRQLEHQDAEQIRHLIRVYEATHSDGDGKASAPDSPAIQLLASPLSTRMLMDAVGSPEGLKALAQQVHRLPKEGHFDQPAAFVGLSVSLAHMLSVIRTMDEHVTHLGEAVSLPKTEQGKLMRQVMDMCRTAAPKPKLEKLRTDVLKQVGAHQSLRFDHELLKQVSHYPESVWINIEAKSSVQQWLREAQGLHYRREGVLGITGQWNQDALRIVAPAA
jgi:hypothetical protein